MSRKNFTLHEKMEHVFDNQTKFFAYLAFKQQMSRLSLFLDIKTVTSFTALSKYFLNILNNPKSEFGKSFWKAWAVKNGVKAYKGKTMNFRFMYMKKMFGDFKKKINHYKIHRRFTCLRCGNPCAEEYIEWYYHDRYYHYCNCEKSWYGISKITSIQNEISEKKMAKLAKKKELLEQLKKLDLDIEKLENQEKDYSTRMNLDGFKYSVGVIKKSAHYSNTRKQATKLLKDVESFERSIGCERRNLNYKPPLGGGLGH